MNTPKAVEIGATEMGLIQDHTKRRTGVIPTW